MSEFVSASPPSGGITWADHAGALLVIEPLAIEQSIKTVHGDANPVRANVHILTSPGEAETFDDCLVFPKVLAGQLRGQIGKKVVGRLGQGLAKPSQTAPWVLEPATDEDLAKAKAWLEKSKPTLTSAAPPF